MYLEDFLSTKPYIGYYSTECLLVGIRSLLSFPSNTFFPKMPDLSCQKEVLDKHAFVYLGVNRGSLISCINHCALRHKLFNLLTLALLLGLIPTYIFLFLYTQTIKYKHEVSYKELSEVK